MKSITESMAVHAGVLRFLTGALACLVLSQNLSAQPAEFENPDQRISNEILISVIEPALAISVDDSFDYIGRHPITIGNVAAGERFVYADVSEGVIQRLFMVQFEGFLPEIDNEYRYDLSKSPIVAGYPFRSNGFVFNVAASIAANPGKESDSTQKFLDETGLISPEEWMMWRSLTVVDEARKKEMIIFYFEDVASTGLKFDELIRNDAATQEWIRIQKQLEMRGNAAYRLAPLDGNGEPVKSAWESVPNTVMVNN